MNERAKVSPCEEGVNAIETAAVQGKAVEISMNPIHFLKPDIQKIESGFLNSLAEILPT